MPNTSQRSSQLTLAEAKAMTQLHSSEREYVTGMKRKDRQDIMRLIGSHERVWCEEAPLRIQVLQSELPYRTRLQIFDDVDRNLCEKYRNWVRRIIRLPLRTLHPSRRLREPLDVALRTARQRMDESITGHADAKREVLKLLCQMHASGGSCASNYSLGFEGPPGTGKTHFVKTALAAALDRPLVCIPLGGANDVAYLMGNLYVYEGSKEGRLASALVEARCCNPIVYFDEVDKVSTTERASELTAALIHLVDPTTNASLRDRYFHNLDIDYSQCTFVFSYNNPSAVSPILLDRIKRISMPTPTVQERRSIVTDHLLPRVQRRLKTSITLSDEAVNLIVRKSSTADGGMRIAERDVDHVVGNAHLCKMCNHSDGEVAGAADTPVFGEDGVVTLAFATAVLQPSGGSCPPPTGMYT